MSQETRHWDEDSGTTKTMRSKEEAFDYRYFPEPDIPALEPDDAWIAEIRRSIPELPRARRARYVDTLGLKPEVARVLVADREAVVLFEETVALGAEPAASANWITQDLAGLRNEVVVADAAGGPTVTAQHIADLVALVADGTLSGAGAKRALEEAFQTGAAIGDIVERRGLRQVSDAGELGALVDRVLGENEDAAEKFRAGNESVIGFLVGQVMKASGGLGEPDARAGAPARAALGVGRAVRVDPKRNRVPFWQLALYATAARRRRRHAPDPEDVARGERDRSRTRSAT